MPIEESQLMGFHDEIGSQPEYTSSLCNCTVLIHNTWMYETWRPLVCEDSFRSVLKLDVRGVSPGVTEPTRQSGQ